MYLEPVTKEQLESIYNEFQITEESFKEGVKYLEEWIRRQPHLPNVDGNALFSKRITVRTKVFSYINKNFVHNIDIFLM